MKDTSRGAPTSRSDTGRPRWPAWAAFAAATAAGATILAMRWLFHGNANPFDVEWPLYLQVGACLSAIVVGVVSGRPIVAACGLYFGLNLVMLNEGSAEYPVASMIALGVHGLLPALAGALCSVVIRRASGSQRSEECA